MDSQFQLQQSPDVPLSLWQSVEDLICKIQHDQPSSGMLGPDQRRRLHGAGEQRALEVLRTVERTTIKTTFDRIVNYFLNQSSTAASPVRRTCMSPLSPPSQQAATPTPTRPTLVFANQVNASTQSPVAEHRQTARALDFDDCAGEQQKVSSQLRALGELEFRRAFLILNYLGSKRLEESITADKIRDLKDLPMGSFESRVWDLLGGDGDRVKCLNWDSDKTHLYDCHVSLNGSCRFKGPYLEKTKNHLQKVLGDDNILRVKFSEADSVEKVPLHEYWESYKNIAKDGITVGLRRYHFFVFKDGGKEEKKKDPTSAGVKCYFVRLESNAQIDINQTYILSGKTVQEARRVFMHVHTLDNLARYMARLSLILSKALKMEVDLDTVDIQKIEDIYCLDENGSIIMGKDGKKVMLSDGTGFISEDLASLCPASVYKGVSINRENEQPLMIQFRCFHEGYAYKGTVVLNRKLPPRTIQVRKSMIKVYADKKLTNVCSASSFEIVATSNQPKKTCLNRNLIALLSNGGVPDDFFLDLLMNSLEETGSIFSKKRSALRAVLQDGEFDNFGAARMILSGIPLEESYLQHKLSKVMNEENNNLRVGKLPIADSFYVMGTVDPTKELERDEVCVILNEGHLSGKVLVYRNPGLHFGDVHIMTARYVDALREYVGNAKYGIFFSSKGTRSVADEMGGGDYDGDMYFVSRNHKLLEHYQKSEPWICASTFPSETPPKRPEEFSPQELEDELFKLFLETRFQPSYTVGIAADSWLVIMDRFLGSGALDPEEKNQMKENLLQLIDIYYHALDAPKGGGKKVDVTDLKPDVYPEHMGKQFMPSFKSNSILQKIHDTVKAHFQEKQENLSNIEVRILPCFDITEIGFSTEDMDRFLSYAEKWENLYKRFRDEMSAALKGEGYASEVTYTYCQHFDEKAEHAVIEALAIYNVVYKHARCAGDVKKCHFPWRVAGDVLCKYYIGKTQTSDTTIACAPSVLKDIL